MSVAMSHTTGSTQVLARKWRPRELSALVGQEHVVRALRHALQTRRLHHAYLFTGTRGVGKTTLARILAKALNCETGITDTPCGQCHACREIDQGRFVDLLEVDAATNTGVDEMRELLENAAYAPTAGRYKVYVIDEVHMLSKSAFNAMLKTLEEPPPHILFILATTDPQKIPVTVLSRCLQFNLKQMPPAHVVEHLQRVLTAEGIGFDAPALQLIGRAAQGSMRDALSLTDQAIAHGAGQLTLQSVQDMLGAVDQRHLLDILEALAARDGAALLQVADDLAARSLPLGQALQNLAGLLYRLSVAHLVPAALAADDPDRDTLLALAGRFTPTELQLYYQIAAHGRRELVHAPDEAVGFGMCLLRMLAFLPHGAGPVEQTAPATPRLEPQRPAASSLPVVPAAVIAQSLPVAPDIPLPPASQPEPAAPATPKPPAVSAAPAVRGGGSPMRNPLDALGQLVAARQADEKPSGPVAQSMPSTSPPSAARQSTAGSSHPPGARFGTGGTVAAAATGLAILPETESQSESASDAVSLKTAAQADREAPASAGEPVGRLLPASSGSAEGGARGTGHLSLVHSAEHTRTPAVVSESGGPASPSTPVPVFRSAEGLTADRVVTTDGSWPDRQGWPAFVQVLPAQGLLRQMLDRSQLDTVEVATGDGSPDRLRLTVAVRAYLDPAHAEKAAQLLSRVMGRPVAVTVQLGAAELTAQALFEARERERQANALAAIESDPFVRALHDQLGATVVPGSIRSL